MFDLFEMEIVIYDEFEKFRQYNDPEFTYPYEKRKNLLEKFTFNYGVSYSSELGNYDYSFKEENVLFRISQVCMENNYLDQLFIFNLIGSKGNEVFNKYSTFKNNDTDKENKNEFECNG